MTVPTRLAAWTASALLVGALVAPSDAHGQGTGPALIGTFGGLFAGGLVSVGVWTAEARFAGEYLYDVDEALNWQAAPIVIGLGAGLTMGITNRDRLYGAGRGAGIGGASGAVVGALLGTLVWEDPERSWAGGVIGAGAGILLGSVIGALTVEDSPDGGDLLEGGDLAGSSTSPLPLASVRIPVGF